jgi:hypothetical protein
MERKIFIVAAPIAHYRSTAFIEVLKLTGEHNWVLLHPATFYQRSHRVSTQEISIHTHLTTLKATFNGGLTACIVL